MFEFSESFNFNCNLLFKAGVRLFITKVDYLNCNSFFSGLINAFEEFSLFGEFYLIIEAVRIILYFFPQLVLGLTSHNNKVII